MAKKTPMDHQYETIKINHQDKILLFRLGDFYEVFHDDALATAKILNIALTKRHDKPMCGFPHHALEQYAYKLVEAGHKVAICEQVEDASVAKGIVKREVVSILTKGTWTENPLLDRSVNSFLAVFTYLEKELAIVFSDISTGDIIIRSTTDTQPLSFLSDELMRYTPVESLCSTQFALDFSIQEELKIYQESLRILDPVYFHDTPLFDAYKNREKVFFQKVSLAKEHALKGLFHYLEENYFTIDSIKHILSPVELQENDTLLMNEDTMRHLELITGNSSDKGSLFSILNKTKTAPGARKLRRLLVAPSAYLPEVVRQQNRTEYLVHLAGQTVSEILKGISDLEHLSARLITGKILPKECLALADSIEKSEKLKRFLSSASPFQDYLATLHPLDHLVASIHHYLNPECFNSIDGNTIRVGIHKELDSYRDILENGKNFLIQLQTEERINTGINTLKIAYNKIYGYYIEVSKTGAQKVPAHYIRKQSLVNAERYTIPALDEFENKINKAEAIIVRLSGEIYQQLIQELQQDYQKILPLAEFISEVDLRNSLAQVARSNRYQKPTINDQFNWTIKDGRHPIIEVLLHKEQFIANDTTIDQKKSRISIVTGPNMAGKSTYLRQNALFAVMAQIGSYLPVSSAVIGVVDRIFTRIGASDDLGAGRSTFFVEMQEAATILNKMTPRSLVIMDELGRGTSTLDGLALSWSILEFLLFHPNKQGKVLFSTHYHELTELAQFNSVQNLCMAIKESKGKPIFLRKVIEGKASKSYGIHVADMAGVDPSIIKRAEEILSQLEKGVFFNNKKLPEQTLFPNPSKNTDDVLYQKIRSIDPNSLTPLDALKIIYELKQQEQNIDEE
ncbi:MAG: DNA mismatch repair protein MutS [Brevinema sp.]